jgi:hypothetical protein
MLVFAAATSSVVRLTTPPGPQIDGVPITAPDHLFAFWLTTHTNPSNTNLPLDSTLGFEPERLLYDAILS